MVRVLVLTNLVLVLFCSCARHEVSRIALCEQSTLRINLESVTEATSCSVTDGVIQVVSQGGVQPYSFTLNNLIPQSQTSFTGLSSGIYSVTVTDKNGCTASLDNIAVLAKDFKFSAAVVEDTECVGDNGAITINVEEGTGPFNYKLNDGAFSTRNIFEALAPGKYTILVADAVSCTIQLSITIPAGITGTSWSNDIVPIIKTSCATSGCHDGKTRTDYRIYANAKKNAGDIKSKTQDKSMPYDGPPLPQSQIDLISCWVDDGALEN